MDLYGHYEGTTHSTESALASQQALASKSLNARTSMKSPCAQTGCWFTQLCQKNLQGVPTESEGTNIYHNDNRMSMQL
jgi:hypothetical protein